MDKIKYDFDTVVSRRNTGSLKWDVLDSELPMWVADMDFKTAPEIIEYLENRVSHGIFGYTDVTNEWHEAYISWWKRRHNFEIEKDWLVFCTGVVPAISSTVRKLTSPNENVVIQTPVYNIFFNSIINNGCRVLTSPLKYDNGIYEMDFQDLEAKLSDPQTSLFILCNPHNPAGKIWDKETLKKVGDLCVKYGVTCISDEIHCDIVRPGCEYIPFASVSENCKNCSITCIASTKAFNIAGMQSAAVCIPNKLLRHKVWRALNTDEVAEPNAFAIGAAVEAFNKGEEWLNQLCDYVFENRSIVEKYIEDNIPSIKVVKADATYLIWLDISKLNIDSESLAKKIRELTGLYLCEGIEYGKEGDSFLRLNAACPKTTLYDGLDRLNKAIKLIVGE